jgi:hypothetical protein
MKSILFIWLLQNNSPKEKDTLYYKLVKIRKIRCKK